MRKRTLPAAMLTLLAAFAATVTVAGCGGKGESGKEESSSQSTTFAPHNKHSTKPSY
jgi:hypothetical protein